MISKTLNPVTYVNMETVNYNNGGKGYNAIFVDKSNNYERTVIAIQETDIVKLPSPDTKCYVTTGIVQRNFKSYINLKEIEIVK